YRRFLVTAVPIPTIRTPFSKTLSSVSYGPTPLIEGSSPSSASLGGGISRTTHRKGYPASGKACSDLPPSSDPLAARCSSLLTGLRGGWGGTSRWVVRRCAPRGRGGLA